MEDGPFSREDVHCLVLGVLATGDSIDQVVIDRIHVDGEDSTKKVASIVRRSSRADVLMLPSISLGGFNVVDPYELHRKTKLPILIVNSRKPNMRKIREALRQHFDDWKKRGRVFDLVGSPTRFCANRRVKIYYYAVGLSQYEAESVLRASLRFGKRPEPLRVARAVARALGELSPMESCGTVGHETGDQSFLGEDV